MSLQLGAAEREAIEAHAGRGYPEEACGVLLGKDENERRMVAEVVELENAGESSRHNRYVISPEQFLRAERRARDTGLDVIGFFHSHPDHPAVPSAFDLEHAWPYYSYLIVSVMNGRVTDARSWRLTDDRSRFDPEPLAAAIAGGPGVERERRTSPDRGENE